MLAQLPDPGAATSVGWVFAVLVGLVLGANAIDDFLRRRRGHPANEELKGGADVIAARVAALEKESNEAMTRRRAMHAKIDDMEKRVLGEVKRDAVDLHNKINKVDRELCALSAHTESQNQQLRHIEAKVDRLIERGIG